MGRKSDAEVNSILQLVLLCQSTGALPSPGGLLDQDSYFIFLYDVVRAAQAEKQKLEDARAAMRGRR